MYVYVLQELNSYTYIYIYILQELDDWGPAWLAQFARTDPLSSRSWPRTAAHTHINTITPTHTRTRTRKCTCTRTHTRIPARTYTRTHNHEKVFARATRERLAGFKIGCVGFRAWGFGFGRTVVRKCLLLVVRSSAAQARSWEWDIIWFSPAKDFMRWLSAEFLHSQLATRWIM